MAGTTKKTTKKTSKKTKLYKPKDIDDAVRSLLDYMGSPRSMSSKALRVRAGAVMLHKLASASGGNVIAGCCSQDCCDIATLKMIRGIPKG